LFFGNNPARKLRLLAAGERSAQVPRHEWQDWCFICENLLASRIQPSIRENYSQSSALTASQSALLPGITNHAFQQFRLLAAVLEGKMALLEWKMAIMLGSMAAQYG